ncbi:MAG: hypothetical protein RL219_2159 [Actinomycetota bacterium]
MRNPSDLPSRRLKVPRLRLNTRWRVAIGVVIVAFIIGLFSARGIASFYVDSLWYRSVGRSDVFWDTFWVKVVLGVGCATVFAVLAALSLTVADRIAPTVRPAGPEEEMLERVRSFIGARRRLLRAAIAIMFGLMVGLPAAAKWREWLLFRNSVSFGTKDPQFGQDVSWYVFRLPFLTWLIGWLFSAFLIVLILTAVAHYVNGGIRTSGPAPHVTPQVKLHISVILAVLAVLKAGQYWLRRYTLTSSTRGFVQGAGYTDVKATLPALNLLILISLAAAALLIWNVRQRGWRLPVIAVGLWAVVAIVAGTLYPAVIQKFRVEPSQSKRERPYIQRNIDLTQQAFGLDTAVSARVPVTFGNVSTPSVQQATEALSNVRLLDPKQDAIRQAFTQQQRPQGFYEFADLDVDRYEIDGKLQQVIVAARVVAEKLPNSSWENTHLAYTHGHGLVAAPASRVAADGRPLYEPEVDSTALGVTRPEIYVGDGMPGTYVVLKSNRAAGEIGPTGPGERYSGSGGVRAGSVFRRLAFALKFGEYNLFGSGLIESDSRVLWVRDVRERVQKIAPFLSLDSDPYPVALDGRIVWVVDAYTTTSEYPYSENADTSQLPAGSGLRKSFNYVRNSVKAVVDSYEGDVTFYRMDETDPVAAAWAKVFPKLFKPKSALPAGLRDHLRYPEDLLRVQTAHLGKYHLTQADDFFNSDLRWCVTQNVPGQQSAELPTVVASAVPSANTSSAAASATKCSQGGRFVPYYALFTPPGADKPEFALIRPFAPFSPDDTLQVLRAFATGTVDANLEPRLTLYDVQGAPPAGPYTAHLQIQSELSQAFTLEDSKGSKVLFGDMQIVPVGDGLVYARPIYVKAEGQTAIPDLRYVVVIANDKLGQGDSLTAALNNLFPGAEVVLGDRGGTSTTTPTTGPSGPSGPSGASGASGATGPAGVSTVGQLLAEASALFDEADAALRAGDLGTYQSKVKAARAKIEAAEVLLSGSPRGASGASGPSGLTGPSGPASVATSVPAPTPTA